MRPNVPSTACVTQKEAKGMLILQINGIRDYAVLCRTRVMQCGTSAGPAFVLHSRAPLGNLVTAGRDYKTAAVSETV